MFDLNADDGSVRKKEFKSPLPAPKGGNADEFRSADEDFLDSPTMVEMHHRCIAIYTNELDRQHDNRIQMAVDHDFYDNIQWSPEDEAELEERNQKAVVYNVISASVDWVIGTEKRARSDFKVLPRRKEEGKPAERKQQLLKYLSDVNKAPFHVSRAFEDSVKGGIGWTEDAVQDEDEDEPIYTRYESWRNMLWDSASTELDLKDARYVIRSKWLDLDVAKAMFKKRGGMLEMSATDSDDFLALDLYGDEAMDSQEEALEGQGGYQPSERVHAYQRRRVRLIEMWIRMPITAKRLKGGRFSGELYDPWSVAHREEVARGEAEIVEKTTMRMHVAIFTQRGMVWFSESPYRHNTFPFTPIWGKRRSRDNMPYGMIRGLRGMQEDINKRASKALYILSTNKVIMDEGAVDDLDELEQEVAKPNGIIVKKQNKELTINTDRDLSQYQLELMSRSISMVQQASGVTDELLGRRTNATSGIAIQRRQDQGSMATATYFDNLRFASQTRGEKQLSLIEQFVSERKAFRITNMRGNPEYIEVNDGMPENDIVRTKADYVITEADWRATMRQAAVDELLEVISKMPPAVGMVLLDLVVENMDIANRDEIVRRIRQVTGQRDPDAEELTPEEQAQQQSQAELQQLQKADLVATLREKMAKAAKMEADAERVRGEVAALQEKLIGTRVSTQRDALEAAKEALVAPAVAHTADHILSESGFMSQSDRDAAARQAESQQAQPGAPVAPGPAFSPGLPAA